MVISDAQLAGWLTAWWLPFVRISAAMMAAPLFSHRAVLPQVRLGIALVVAALLAPWQPTIPDFNPLSLQGVLMTANEILIGVLMGFILQLVFEAVLFAGQFIATGMGLGFATLVDPQQGISVAVVGQFLMMMALLLFLAMNGHLAYIQMVADSFALWPIGSAWVSPDTLQLGIAWVGQMLRGALGIALPAVIALLVVQIAMGVMSRSAPSLNLFAVGFPVTLMVGLIVLERTLPALLPQLERLFLGALDAMRQLLESGNRVL